VYRFTTDCGRARGVWWNGQPRKPLIADGERGRHGLRVKTAGKKLDNESLVAVSILLRFPGPTWTAESRFPMTIGYGDNQRETSKALPENVVEEPTGRKRESWFFAGCSTVTERDVDSRCECRRRTSEAPVEGIGSASADSDRCACGRDFAAGAGNGEWRWSPRSTRAFRHWRRRYLDEAISGARSGRSDERNAVAIANDEARHLRSDVQYAMWTPVFRTRRPGSSCIDYRCSRTIRCPYCE